ncbi:hypothetical protein [Marinobacter sp. OP 3.4]|uniref:hypothetical protein n=1 Tax=Marinobacter sp. OP 3.4 TaxID=3076501 RepID=UPI002E1DEB94
MAGRNGPTMTVAVSSADFSVHVSLLTTYADGESWSVLASPIGSVVVDTTVRIYCKSLILLEYLSIPNRYLTDSTE